MCNETWITKIILKNTRRVLLKRVIHKLFLMVSRLPIHWLLWIKIILRSYQDLCKLMTIRIQILFPKMINMGFNWLAWILINFRHRYQLAMEAWSLKSCKRFYGLLRLEWINFEIVKEFGLLFLNKSFWFLYFFILG